MVLTKKSGDIAVTKEMLDETRNELKSDIAAVRLEMKAGLESVKDELRGEINSVKDELRGEINSIKDEISGMKGDINGIKGEISGMKVDITEVKADIKQLTAAVHRSLALYEEQEARNKYVLDGYQNLHDRQDRFEKEIKEDISAIKLIITKGQTIN